MIGLFFPAPAPCKAPAVVVLGVISDTHGLLRPEALEALRGVDRIVHAGDVCGRGILEALSLLARVDAVRGNNDHDPFGRTLPRTLDLEIGGLRVHVLHDRGDLRAEAADADVVISGHSHRAAIERVGRTLYLDPGSAGPRRFSLPISLAKLTIDRGVPTAEIVRLDAA